MSGLKVTSMNANAERAIKRARQTKGGIHIWVGYSGKAITAGDKVMRSLPHLRIEVAPDEKQEELETKLALAVLQLRKTLPAALKKWTPPKPPKPTRKHGWSRKGASGGDPDGG